MMDFTVLIESRKRGSCSDVPMRDAAEQLQAKNEELKKALRKNIEFCEYYDGEKRCGEIATWGVFDYDGWEEYYCNEHKNKKTSRNRLEKLANQILAEQALKRKQ